MREDKQYVYNHEQLKGVLMLAYGPMCPPNVALEYADRVIKLLNENEEVQALIASMGEET